MRVVSSVLIIGILFSYIPVFPMDECPEGNHMGKMKMDCGSLFHCPMIVDLIISAIWVLSLNGRLVSTKPLLLLKELTHTIFHPPEHLNPNLFLRGSEEGKQFNVGPWYKNC